MGAMRKIVLHWTTAALLLGSVPAVGLGDEPFRLENRLSELEFEKARLLVALADALSAERAALQGERQALDEKQALSEELSRKESALQTATEQLQKAISDGTELEKALAEVRDSERRIREVHEKVKGIATSANEQLEDLRQKIEAITKERNKLLADGQGLSKQLDVATRELDDIKSELTKTRAVVRAFQESPAAGAGSSDPALRARILELEIALSKAEQAARKADGGDSSGAASAQAAGTAGAAQLWRGGPHDPKVLWKGLVSLAHERYADALEGRFRGDSFDWAAVGVLSGGLLFALHFLISRFRIKRLRRKLKAYETGRKPVPAVKDTAESEESVASPAGEGAPARPPSRRNIYLPREDREFSAIISAAKPSKEPSEGEERTRAEKGPVARPSAPPTGLSREVKPPVAGPSRDPKPQQAGSLRDVKQPAVAEPRRVIGAAFGESFGQRKPFQPAPDRPGAGPAPRAPAAPPAPAPRPQAREPEPEDEMANTQIISPLAGIEKRPVRGKGPSSPAREEPSDEGDKDLLNELKDIINKKFDELTQ